MPSTSVLPHGSLQWCPALGSQQRGRSRLVRTRRPVTERDRPFRSPAGRSGGVERICSALPVLRRGVTIQPVDAVRAHVAGRRRARYGLQFPGQRARCTGRSRCCAVSARRSASNCSSSACVRRRSSKAMHRSRSVRPLPGSVPPADRAGAPHRHPQVTGGSIPVASATVNACPRAHRYAACWREAGWAPGRSAIPAPAPGLDRHCREMIMNSPGPAK